VKVSTSGAITLLCIFHEERTPSLRIWPDGGFRCFGCGVHGKVEDHEHLAGVFHQVHAPEREVSGQLRLPGV